MMDDIHWRLGGARYSDYHDFVSEVRSRNEEMDPLHHGWRPDEIVCKGPIKVQYEIPWKEMGEDLIEFTISASHEPITMGQLLFHLHNESAEFFSKEHHSFFEGLSQPSNGTVYLSTGS